MAVLVLRVSKYQPTQREKIVAAIAAKLSALMVRLQQYIVREKLSGQVLNVRSGRLVESVQPVPATIEGPLVKAGVLAGGDAAFYAPYHEFGGKAGYEILPVRAKALVFEWMGQMNIRSRVFRGALPARPYMAPSLAEFTPQIVQGLEEAIGEAVNA
ncbi:MAG: hypothetical protein ACRD2H_11465 [Terriglobales bacterium]